VGVGASGLQPDDIPVQADLFTDSRKDRDAKWEKVDRAMDAVADRFGKSAIKRGETP
jgi:DNA polymerase IV